MENTNGKIGASSSKIYISRFDTRRLSKPSQILIIGQKGTGKTNLVFDLITKISNNSDESSTKNTSIDSSKIIVISGAEKMDNLYKNAGIPEECIYHNLEDFDFKGLQEEIINDINMQKKRGSKIPHRFLIVDGCIFSSGFKDEIYNNIVLQARRYNISIIMTMQYPICLHPSLRHNFDYCFLFQHCGDASVFKKMYDFYAGIFPSLDSFKKVFSQIVSACGECMVISNKSSDRSFDEKVSCYTSNFPNKLSVTCPTKDPFIVSINDMTKQLKNDLDGIVYATKLTIDEILTDMTFKVNSIKIQFEKDKNILLHKYEENKNIDTDEKYIGSLFREKHKDDIGSKRVDICEYNENESEYDDDIDEDDIDEDDEIDHDDKHVVLFKTSSFDFEEIFKCDKRPTNNGHSNIKKNIDEMQI